MKSIRLFFSLLIMLSLTHCLSYDLSRNIVQQGNLLPAHQVQRLKIGMTRQDVYQLLGSSLIQNLFNPNRLDYAYSLQKGGKKLAVRTVAITFRNDRIIQIQHYP
jgi:outer membrane protein assembly factor BamE